MRETPLPVIATASGVVIAQSFRVDLTAPPCPHAGGFRTDSGSWECSRCGQEFASHEAWGAETGNEAAVAAVKSAIEADLAAMGGES